MEKKEKLKLINDLKETIKIKHNKLLNDIDKLSQEENLETFSDIVCCELGEIYEDLHESIRNIDYILYKSNKESLKEIAFSYMKRNLDIENLDNLIGKTWIIENEDQYVVGKITGVKLNGDDGINVTSKEFFIDDTNKPTFFPESTVYYNFLQKEQVNKDDNSIDDWYNLIDNIYYYEHGNFSFKRLTYDQIKSDWLEMIKHLSELV